MSFTVATPEGIAAIEAHLATNGYLSGGNLPTEVDAALLDEMQAAHFHTNQAETPNFFGWWWTLCAFQPIARQTWGAAAGKKGGKAQKKAAAPAEEEDDEDLDLFGDDPEAEAEAAKQAEARKAAAAKKKKPKKQAKSIIVFNVKGYEVGFDWDSYADTIRAIEHDGVTWMDSHKVVDIAFGMKMLQMTCIIIDDLVITDDLWEKIQADEENVQSVDVVSFDKA